MALRRSVGGGRKRKASQPSMGPQTTVDTGPLKIRYVDKDGISDNLRCTICQDIFSYPIALLCGHVFCDGCIRDWLVKNKHDTCPECRAPASMRMSHKDMIAHKFLDSVPVYCAYLGCPWVGRMEELETHAKYCEFNPTKLPEWMVSKKSKDIDNEDPSEGTSALRMRLFKSAQNQETTSSIKNLFTSTTTSSGPSIGSLESLTSDLVRSEDIISRNKPPDAFIDISDSD